MRAFWNERARENAFYFVDTRQDYRAPDPERFFDSAELLDYLLDGLGVGLRGYERGARDRLRTRADHPPARGAQRRR